MALTDIRPYHVSTTTLTCTRSPNIDTDDQAIMISHFRVPKSKRLGQIGSPCTEGSLDLDSSVKRTPFAFIYVSAVP